MVPLTTHDHGPAPTVDGTRRSGDLTWSCQLYPTIQPVRTLADSFLSVDLSATHTALGCFRVRLLAAAAVAGIVSAASGKIGCSNVRDCGATCSPTALDAAVNKRFGCGRGEPIPVWSSVILLAQSTVAKLRYLHLHFESISADTNSTWRRPPGQPKVRLQVSCSHAFAGCLQACRSMAM
jgi:hypothetical protein